MGNADRRRQKTIRLIMPPNYDYLCAECNHITIHYVSFENRDTPQVCEACDGLGNRVYATPPQVRTAKTSRTFVDGTRNDGYAEEIKAAALDSEAMNHRPESSKYKELKAEAAARRLLNNNPEKRGKRYRLDTGKKAEPKQEKK